MYPKNLPTVPNKVSRTKYCDSLCKREGISLVWGRLRKKFGVEVLAVLVVARGS
jgi:hypothetical protein